MNFSLLSALRSEPAFKTAALLLLIPSLVFFPSPSVIVANPAGGVVVHGAAEFGEDLGGHLSIFQGSDKAIINWESFSISPGELTQFQQPGPESAALNRVVTGNPSAIHGALRANGKILLVNPNGVVVGPAGSVDTNGFVASTLNVSDAEFLAGGDLNFSGPSEAGVENYGRINAVGGDVFLIGKHVVNAGSISASNGRVGLAAGSDVLLAAEPDANGEQVFVRPTPGGVGSGTGISNTGIIQGASVELKAHGNMYALAINNGGTIRATGVTRSGGSVFLVAEGGRIDNTGIIEATLPNGDGGRIVIDGGAGGLVNAGGQILAEAIGGGTGGSVTILGEEIYVPGGAVISANGGTGGTVQIGANPFSNVPGEAEALSVDIAPGSSVSANGLTGAGGQVTISGGDAGVVTVGGEVSATSDEADGGEVHVKGHDVTASSTSTINVSGGQNGGGAYITADGQLIAAGIVMARGVNGTGGRINLDSGPNGSTEVTGTLDAVGGGGNGGQVIVEGNEVTVGSSAVIDASGETGGGTVAIGGGFQGKDSEIRNSQSTTVEAGARIRADAAGSGKGGVVVVWSDGDTLFQGDISAQGINGGGLVEVSGKQRLGFDGTVSTLASDGPAGLVLLDPTNGTISSGGDDPTGDPFNINNENLSALLDQGNDVIVSTSFGPPGDSGDLDVLDRVEWYREDDTTDPGTLTLLATGDIQFDDHVRSAGTGGINVVAGWDGSTGLNSLSISDGDTLDAASVFDMDAILATMNDVVGTGNDAAGKNGGSVGIGRNAGSVRRVEVGSRFGDTNLAAHDLLMKASNNGAERWAQLGFHDTGYEFGLGDGYTGGDENEWWGDASLNVRGKDYLNDLGGSRQDLIAPGEFDGAGSGATGNIEVALSGRLEMRSSSANFGYVQIGHGGSARAGVEPQGGANEVKTTRDGFDMNPGDNNRQFFSTTWRTEFEADPLSGTQSIVDGAISVHAGEEITIIAAPSTINDGNDTISADGSTGMYAKIGHGGDENHGSYHGDITVIAEGTRGGTGVGIELRGGRGSSRFAQIGHGSHSEGNRRNIQDQRNSGEIVVRAENGAVRAIGFNQLPVTGDLNTGTLLDENTPLPSGSGADVSSLYSPVQIGHGGAYSQPPTSGNFDVPDNSLTGNITVYAGGTFTHDTEGEVGIEFHAGNSQGAYAQIGNGGYNHRANTGGAEGFTGNILVEADQGSILFTGGEEKRSQRDWGFGYNHAMIGNGGYNVDGDYEGSITVLAGQGAGAPEGSIIFNSGRMQHGFAQIGHGGSNSNGDVPVAGASPIAVTALDGIAFTSRLSGPSDAYHLAGDYQNWYDNEAARIAGGHPDARIRSRIWDTSVKYVQIGHGGSNGANAVADNSIDVTAQGGDITFTTGDNYRDFAHIGHGGWENGSDANLGGDITVTAGGSIVFDARNGGAPEAQRSYVGYETVFAGQGQQTFAMIGHGGYDWDGDHTGDIAVHAGGNLHFIGPSTGTELQEVMDFTGNALDGHGETMLFEASQRTRTFQLSQTDITPGTLVIDVNGGNDVTDNDLGGGTGELVKNGNVVGSIDYATGLVTINDRVQTDDNADEIEVDFDHAGGSVSAESTIEIDSALRASDAFLGHGALVPGSVTIVVDGDDSGAGRAVYRDSVGNGQLRNSAGQVVGNVNYGQGRVRFNEAVNAAGDEVVAHYEYTEGNSDDAFVQLGHGGIGSNAGGRNSPGHSGAIRVSADGVTANGDIRFHGGAFDRNYAQLGHGGDAAQGQHGGDPAVDDSGLIEVGANGIIEFLSGRGASYYDDQLYAQLGHGGRDADGQHQGDIHVSAGSGEASVAPGQIGGGASGQGLVFTSGETADAYSLLGHGGTYARSALENGIDGRAGLTGDIIVETAGDITFTAGTMRSNFIDYNDGRLYTQLGHGGYDADIQNQGNDPFDEFGHHGDIQVTSTAGSISFSGGDHTASGLGDGYGILGYAQLGHGGYGTNGSHWGDITVDAAGDVRFTAGERTHENSTDKRNFAHLGHGGDSSAGDMGENNPAGQDTISVTSGQDIVFTGGDGRRDWAMLGNGGFQSRGDQRANINIGAGRDLLFSAGIGVDQGYQISGERSRELDYTSWEMGWAPLRYNGVHDGTLVITVDPDGTANEFVDDGDGNLIDPGDALGLGADAIVGKVNYSTGHVRFDVVIDPTGAGTEITYDTGSNSNPSHRTENSGTNNVNEAVDLLAASGPAMSVPGISAYFNNTRGGMNQLEQDAGQPGDNLGIEANSFMLSLPDGETVTDDGAGNLVHSAIGNVGTIDYARGLIVLTEVINPTGKKGVTLDYQIDHALGAGLAFAQLGNGGYNADQGNNDEASIGAVGDVMVDVERNLIFEAGGGQAAYAQLGNGGYANQGEHQGDIKVYQTLGDFLFEAGTVAKDTTDNQAYAQLGHGGYDADGDHWGDIEIYGRGSLFEFLGGEEDDNYAQLGHGGRGSQGVIAESDISVVSQADIQFSGGTGNRSYAQLGHGGHGQDDNTVNVGNSGAIRVASTDGGLTFHAGDGNEAYVQLGHGGHNNDSDHGWVDTGGDGSGDLVDGDILVRTSGDISFVASPSTNNDTYAQLGHGGYTAGGLEFGHRGDITVTAGIGGDFDDIINLDGDGAFGGDADDQITVLAGDADMTFQAGGDGGQDSYAHLGHGGGEAGGGIGHRGAIGIDMTGDLSLLGGRDNEAYAMIGMGGHSANVDDNSDLTQGHRSQITITAGTVSLRGSPVGNGDDNIAPQAFAQIGSGGRGANGNHGGDISVTAMDVDGSGNSVVLQGGDSAETYAQIGSGGRESNGSHGTTDAEGASDADGADGDITIQAEGHVQILAGLASRAYAQVGNGGDEVDDSGTPRDQAGNITIRSTSGGLNIVGGSDTGVNDDDHLAMVGNGGHGVSGNHSGNILIDVGGDITLEAGDADRTLAMIGNGGQNADGNHSGDLDVTAGGSITMTAGNTKGNNFVQIGNGGQDADGDHSGSISVEAAAGTLTMTGGTDTNAYAQIGNGGVSANGSHGASGDSINVKAGSDIRLEAGDTNNGYVMIGNGGVGLGGGRTLEADISVISDNGNIDLLASDSTNDDAFVMIGNGGTNVNSNGLGDIWVEALNGTLTLTPGTGTIAGGSDDPNFALIGHGGYDNSGNQGAVDGRIVVNVDALTMQGGSLETAYAQIGHGGYDVDGDLSGDIFINYNPDTGMAAGGGGDIQILGSTSPGVNDVYARIGHGGEGGTPGDMIGGITIGAADNILIQGGQAENNTAQIGHGGADSNGDKEGDISITASGNVTVQAGDSDGATALVGHGGTDSGGEKTGAVSIETDGEVAILGGSAGDAFAQVGHGGTDASGDLSGAVSVTGGTGVRLEGGTDDNTPAHIGHGEPESEFDPAMGDITVTVLNGSLDLTGGTDQNQSYALIGHGGYRSGPGDKTGNITVDVSQDVNLNGGDASNSFAQIGHGGMDSGNLTLGLPEDNDPSTTVIETLSVTAGNDINLWGGSSLLNNDAYAQIGHGGLGSSAVFGSHVVVTAGNDVNLEGGAGALNYAQIGHGGGGADGTKSGNVLVHGGNEVILTRGTGRDAYAKIGHGDFYHTTGGGGSGFASGDIQVSAGQHFTSTGGLVGHVDPDIGVAAVTDGDTYVAVSRDDVEHGGTGTLTTDADAVFASMPGGELRFYLPDRGTNLMAVGTQLNGTAFTGAEAAGAAQRADEYIFHTVDSLGNVVSTPGEHGNLADLVDLGSGTVDARWRENLQVVAVTEDTANYSTALGNYSLYYDAITGASATPPGSGGSGSTGSGGSSGGTGGSGDASGGTDSSSDTGAGDGTGQAGGEGLANDGSQTPDTGGSDSGGTGSSEENIVFLPVSMQPSDDYLFAEQPGDNLDVFGDGTTTGWGELSEWSYAFDYSDEAANTIYNSFQIFEKSTVATDQVVSPVAPGFESVVEIPDVVEPVFGALGPESGADGEPTPEISPEAYRGDNEDGTAGSQE